MWHVLKKDKSFLISVTFLLLFVLASIGNTIFLDGKVRQVSMQFDKEGNVEVAPFPPSLEFPLGTDRKGYDLLHRVIEGAKWSIGAAFLIAFIRTVFGIWFGMFIAFYVKRTFRTFEAAFDSFSVIPMTLIAFFILETVLTFESWEIPPPFYQRVSFQMMVLIVLALPTLSIYFSNETRKLLSEEFMNAARTLGGSKWHLVKRHLFPNLRPLFLIVFMQQFVQALILFLHLGILGIFFGGTIVFSSGEIESVSSEWSGLIGLYFRSLSANPWIPLVPIGCFILTIIAGNTIVRRMKVAMEKQYEAKEKTDEQEKDEPVTITASSFTFYK